MSGSVHRATAPGRSGARDRRSAGAGRSAVVGVLLAGVAATGCGRVAEADKPSGAREPGIVVLTAVVEDDVVRLSPRRVGAGPVRIVVTNQSRAAVRPELRRGAGTGSSRAAVLEPGGVVSLTTRVTPGRWALSSGAAATPARLVVTAERPSADTELLQP